MVKTVRTVRTKNVRETVEIVGIVGISMSNDSSKKERIRQKCLKNLNANFYRTGMAAGILKKKCVFSSWVETQKSPSVITSIPMRTS